MGKVATSGLVGAAAVGTIEGMNATVTVPRLGRTIPLYAAGGIAAMASSAAASAAHNVLIPALAEEDKFDDNTATALALVSAGAGSAGAWAAMDPRILNQLGDTKAIGYGLVSESVGSWAYNTMVKPMM